MARLREQKLNIEKRLKIREFPSWKTDASNFESSEHKQEEKIDLFKGN